MYIFGDLIQYLNLNETLNMLGLYLFQNFTLHFVFVSSISCKKPLKIHNRLRYQNYAIVIFIIKVPKKANGFFCQKNIEEVILSTKEAKGFVGTYLAMYTSENHFGTAN
jgi:hypothetical protein